MYLIQLINLFIHVVFIQSTDRNVQCII